MGAVLLPSPMIPSLDGLSLLQFPGVVLRLQSFSNGELLTLDTNRKWSVRPEKVLAPARFDLKFLLYCISLILRLFYSLRF